MKQFPSMAFDFNPPFSLYPARKQQDQPWLEKLLDSQIARIRHSLQTRESRLSTFLSNVESQHDFLQSLDDVSLQARIREVRSRLREKNVNSSAVADCFAIIREVAGRTIGMRHYREQLWGGWTMMNGMIAEMETGQGKTLTATLAASTAALSGVPTHVITVNDYLAKRDAQIMAPIYQRLGLSVGVIQDSMPEKQKRDAYACDICYCTNKQIAFDHLRDRMKMGSACSDKKLKLESLYSNHSIKQQLLLRGLYFAIIDEADSILIDEAVTPLIISLPSEGVEKTGFYQRALDLARSLQKNSHFKVLENTRHIELTRSGKYLLAEKGDALGGLWNMTNPREELVTQALKALYLFQRDQHYLVVGGGSADDGTENKVQIIDEFTGRVMADRSWERGLHQMIEVKENCPVSGDRKTAARISYQQFFRRYLNIAGMSGTVKEVAGEIWKVYQLRIQQIPPAQIVQRRTLTDIVVRDQQKNGCLLLIIFGKYMRRDSRYSWAPVLSKPLNI